MLIYEFRVVLPMTVEEYQVAQLYSVAEASKNETGGGEGIEVKANEPFGPDFDFKLMPKESLLEGYVAGQFTHKIYHLHSKVPRWILMFAPEGALEIMEEAWNAYPYCRTIVTNPEYMKDNFFIKIESLHKADRGEDDNAHGLPQVLLDKRVVHYIDIAHDKLKNAAKDYNAEWDPKLYRSEKTGRGPLTDLNWRQTCKPVMCAYKLVTVHFKWWGLQGKVESFIMKAEQRIFTNFHRQVFCWTDKWYGKTMDDIRALEDETKRDLDQQLHAGKVRGTVATDDE